MIIGKSSHLNDELSLQVPTLISLRNPNFGPKTYRLQDGADVQIRTRAAHACSATLFFNHKDMSGNRMLATASSSSSSSSWVRLRG